MNGRLSAGQERTQHKSTSTQAIASLHSKYVSDRLRELAVLSSSRVTSATEIGGERPQHEASLYNTVIDGTQAHNASSPYPRYAEQEFRTEDQSQHGLACLGSAQVPEKEKNFDPEDSNQPQNKSSFPDFAQEHGEEENPGSWDQPQIVQSKLPNPAMCMGENGEMVITNIRATDVALGLRRLPAGFYTAVHHTGQEWRTENKRSSVNDDVEWSESILLPSELSATVCLEVYASFEFQPMLGAGEQLRKLTVNVEQILHRSANSIPFTFFPKDGDIVTPCSSIFVTVKQYKNNNSSPQRVLDSHCLITELRGKLEDTTNQGHSALSRYRKHGVKEDLECSIEAFERTLSICPLDHPCRAAALSNLATAKFILCQIVDSDRSLAAPLQLYRSALDARPIGHVDRPSTLIQLAAVHFARLEKLRDETEGAGIEALLCEAIELSPTWSHENRVAVLLLQAYAGRNVGPTASHLPVDSTSNEDLWDFSSRLLLRFQRFGDLADLQQAIAILENLTAVKSVSGWDDQRHMGIGNLGVALSCRFDHLGDLRDLEAAISSYKRAVDLTPYGHPDKASILSNLGNSLRTRFKRLGKLSDLEGAISSNKDAVDLTPYGHPYMPRRLSNLGIALLARFERLGELSDLETAISSHRDAANLVPRGHPDSLLIMNNLGNSFVTRFERFGELSDLEAAISSLRKAVDLTPRGHPSKPGRLVNLGSTFISRFERLGKLSDLEAAISVYRDAINLTLPGHSHRPAICNNLGNAFAARFTRLDELSDLEAAISNLRDAVDLTPQSHPGRPTFLNNLGVAFFTRFERLGELSDLEAAISCHTNAVDLTPHGHHHKLRHLANLGSSLRARFDYLGELSDLDAAILIHKDVVDLIPHGHPDKPGYLNNLGSSFRARFDRYGEPSDLEAAISSHRNAVRLTPDGHPNKPNRFAHLGSSFKARFERLKELADLEAAISSLKHAVDLTPHGHPGRLGHIINLGHFLTTRFEHLGELSDLEATICLYSHAASAPIGPISSRFNASQRWILCARRTGHQSLLRAYSVAISLLPQLAWIGLPLTRRYVELKKGAHIVREAAAAALDAGYPEVAVEWLEQGRSIVWGGLLQLRSSYEDLFSAHPDHAHKLQELSTALENAGVAREKYLSTLSGQTQTTTHRASLEEEAGRHRALAIERDKLLREVRRFPGFERFLLHKNFAELRASAHSGPVVILNAAGSRCDALIVLENVNHVIHVPLSNFDSQRSAGLQRLMRRLLGHARVASCEERKGKPATQCSVSWESLLSTLWNGITKPVLDALAFSTLGYLPRIFWCPTGPFVFLPIHAAGFYDIQHSLPGHRVSDFVVSSYVPTLSILTQSPNLHKEPHSHLRFLVVGQPTSDGLPHLRGVAPELEHIRTTIRNSHSTRATLLEPSAGTVEQVLGLMKHADWVHFACHGIQDGTHPTESGLCLANGRRLKISDIIALSRSRGGLAFLSACQTAMGDEYLTEEAIHIAAGMLFAGYGGVIGTMWSINDKLAPGVARDVYEQLFRNGTKPDYRDAARALREAIGRLRDSGKASFATWLPFIHVGL